MIASATPNVALLDGRNPSDYRAYREGLSPVPTTTRPDDSAPPEDITERTAMGRRPIAEDNDDVNIVPGTQDVNLKKGDMSLMRMLPIAAGLALVLASATAYAQTAPAAGCTTSQKAGEGGGGNEAGSIAAQKAGEGGGANAAGSVAAQKAGEGDGNAAAGSVAAQKAGEGGGGNEAGSIAAQKAGEGNGANAAGGIVAQRAGAAGPCKG